MHPTVLQAGGLEAALYAVAEQYGRTGDFEPLVTVDPAATGPSDDLLLSVARELLENAARHATAATVRVDVRREGDRVVLEVADDGAGIPPGRAERAQEEGAIGLASSRERVEALGGSLEIDSAPGRGTRVLATTPAQAPDRSARISG
jgi:signal transduction histidine kinase